MAEEERRRLPRMRRGGEKNERKNDWEKREVRKKTGKEGRERSIREGIKGR